MPYGNVSQASMVLKSRFFPHQWTQKGARSYWACRAVKATKAAQYVCTGGHQAEFWVAKELFATVIVVFYMRTRQLGKNLLRFKGKNMSSGLLKAVKFPLRVTIVLSDEQLVSLPKTSPSAVTRVRHFCPCGPATVGTA